MVNSKVIISGLLLMSTSLVVGFLYDVMFDYGSEARGLEESLNFSLTILFVGGLALAIIGFFRRKN